MQAVGKGSEKTPDPLQAWLWWRETAHVLGVVYRGRVGLGVEPLSGHSAGHRVPGGQAGSVQTLSCWDPCACLQTRALVLLYGWQGLSGQEFSIFSFSKDQNKNYDGIHGKN